MHAAPPEVLATIPASKLAAQAKHFPCPAWAASPEPGWVLEVYKAGVFIGKHKIDTQPYYLFGRDVSVVDYVLEHPSISRRHAALVHHKLGSKFVIDMSTKFGTHVNGERVKSLDAIRLQPGDRLKFAESSREYVLAREDAVVPAPRAAAKAPRPPSANSDVPITKKSRTLATPAALAVDCSHIVLKHNQCEHPVDRDKLPVTRTRAAALAQMQGYRRQLLALTNVRDRRELLRKLAREHSDCALTHEKGGHLGVVHRDTLQEEFEAAVFALAPGELSACVETSMGLHLIMRHA